MRLRNFNLMDKLLIYNKTEIKINKKWKEN